MERMLEMTLWAQREPQELSEPESPTEEETGRHRHDPGKKGPNFLSSNRPRNPKEVKVIQLPGNCADMRRRLASGQP